MNFDFPRATPILNYLAVLGKVDVYIFVSFNIPSCIVCYIPIPIASRNGSATSIATTGASPFPFPTMATVLCKS